MTQLCKIAGVQMDVALADPQRNLQRMESALRETHAAGAELTVFPECALPGYCFDSLAEARPWAEPLPGPATQRLAAVCRELGVYAVFGLLEVDGPRLYNAAALVGPEGLVGKYRKVHLPYLGIDMYTTSGDLGFPVFETPRLRIGMNICYDGAFPEAARVMALAGADLIVLPTNWPPGAECTAECIVNARALENNVYYLAVNRVGVERGFRFIGHSRICDTYGRAMASAPHTDEAILYAEIDPARARNKHLIREPGKHEIHRFRDRHPEHYGPIVAPLPADQQGRWRPGA